MEELFIDPDLEKILPAINQAPFDYSEIPPAIDVFRENGRLLVIDGRRRLLGLSKGRRQIAYRVHNLSRPQATIMAMKLHRVPISS